MLVQLVNLDNRPDRLFRFTQSAYRIGLTFERISACNGALPEFSERSAEIAPTARGEVVGPRALACTESHRIGWRRLLESDESHGVMLEDDIYMADDLAAICADAAWVPADADLVKLETMNYRVLLERNVAATVAGRTVQRLRSPHLGTGGYVVSRGGAERLLAGTKVSTDTIDRMMFDTELCALARTLVTYQMTPAPLVQSMFQDTEAPEWGKSDINTERFNGPVDANGFSLRRKLGDKLGYLNRRIRRPAQRHLAAFHMRGTYQRIAFVPNPEA